MFYFFLKKGTETNVFGEKETTLVFFFGLNRHASYVCPYDAFELQEKENGFQAMAMPGSAQQTKPAARSDCLQHFISRN